MSDKHVQNFKRHHWDKEREYKILAKKYKNIFKFRNYFVLLNLYDSQ